MLAQPTIGYILVAKIGDNYFGGYYSSIKLSLFTPFTPTEHDPQITVNHFSKTVLSNIPMYTLHIMKVMCFGQNKISGRPIVGSFKTIIPVAVSPFQWEAPNKINFHMGLYDYTLKGWRSYNFIPMMGI